MKARFAVLAALLAGALAASGCRSGAPGTALQLSPERWREVVASRGVDPGDVPMPMYVSPEIRAVAEQLAGPGDDRERLKRLQSALLDRKSYAFEYDTVATFTASEAFALRRGNCVSFTNLFIAFGRAIGIPLQAALVFRRARSEREGDLVMVYNHMVAVHPKGRTNTVYDFYLTRDGTPVDLRLIDDIAVAAISASNRGIEALRAGDLEKASVLLERATKLDPDASRPPLQPRHREVAPGGHGRGATPRSAGAWRSTRTARRSSTTSPPSTSSRGAGPRPAPRWPPPPPVMPRRSSSSSRATSRFWVGTRRKR